jgi:hypothetical protein
MAANLQTWDLDILIQVEHVFLFEQLPRIWHEHDNLLDEGGTLLQLAQKCVLY